MLLLPRTELSFLSDLRALQNPREKRHMAKGPSILQRPEGQCENLEALGGAPANTAGITGAEESGVFVPGYKAD